MIENPAERVFHIDRECYLIYLGSSHTEYRPFLRIGNSTKLPEEIKKYVSTVLVTDNYTGNPFLEHENVELPLNGETRFVGDPVRIERLKQFLNEKNLPVAEYEYETVESPPQKGKSIVFFFKNGNLHVHHNGDELFNLRQREMEDLHFVYLAERVSSFVKDNPLRYLSRVFQNPGFIFLGPTIYLFHEGRLGVLDLPKDYLWALSRAGIDPDLLQWCIEERFEEGILQKLKRSVAIKKELRVASHRTEQLRSTINLFSGMDASLFAVEPDPSGCFHLQGFQFCGEEVSVEFPSSLGISFSLSSTLSSGKTVIQKALEKKGFPVGANILGNLPYRFYTLPLPSPSTLLLSYGINMARNCAEVGDVQEQDWWRVIVSSLTQFQEQWNKTSPRISSFDSIESLFMEEIPLKETRSVVPYLIWNLETLCNIIDPAATSRGSVWERLRKKARNSSLFKFPEDREGCIPLVGDFWVRSNGLHLFYQIEGRLTPLKLLQAAKSIENIERIRTSLENEEHFVRERERLLRFLGQLHQVPPKRIKKAVSSNKHEPQLQTTPPQSPQSSIQASAQPGFPGQPKPPPSHSIGEPTLSGMPLTSEPVKTTSIIKATSIVKATSKGQGSFFQSFADRNWGIYLMGGLFLAGIIIALWQFDLFPHRERIETVTKTPQEKSISPESTSGKTEQNKNGKEINILSPSKTEGGSRPDQIPQTEEPSQARGDIPVQKGSEGQRKIQEEQRNPQLREDPYNAQLKSDQLSRNRQDADAQKGVQPQKGVTEQKPVEGDTLPSTYAANIPPLGIIQITVLDVFYLVNEIADTNGYRRLDSPKDIRPDPNWIYPGNRFKLPDSSVYIVKRGDTLWGITTRYIEQEVAKGIAILKSYLGPTLESIVPKDKKSELERILEALQKESHCKAFKEYLEKKKKEVVYS